MLACKSRYFIKYEDYDDFALYAATTVYTRITGPTFQNNPDRQVKSILNYLSRGAIYPLKVTYQIEAYQKTSNPNREPGGMASFEAARKAAIQADYSDGLQDVLLESFKELPALA